LFAYKINKFDKQGVLSSSGGALFVHSFDKVKPLDSNIILGLKDNNVTLINAQTGNFVIVLKGVIIKKANQGKYLVNKGAKWGMLSKEGKWILPMKYSKISKFNSSGFAVASSKKGQIYILTDNTITEEKPKRKITQPKQIIEPLLPVESEQYVGVKSFSIPARYHQIAQLKNGCFVGSRFHQYIIHAINGREIIHSDLWVSAQLIDNHIVEVFTNKSVKYFNLQTQQWVWGND
jgi:hypothetical protein